MAASDMLATYDAGVRHATVTVHLLGGLSGQRPERAAGSNPAPNDGHGGIIPQQAEGMVAGPQAVQCY